MAVTGVVWALTGGVATAWAGVLATGLSTGISAVVSEVGGGSARALISGATCACIYWSRGLFDAKKQRV